MRRLFCLLGDPVAHSLSPKIHARAFALLGVDAVYAPCRVAADGLPQAVAGLRALGAAGFNVTVPHKGAAVALCDRVSQEAGRIGGVNCVQRSEDGQLVGHNTDAPGLLRALRGVDLDGARAVVIGAGGSARAAAMALAARVASIAIVNRSEDKARSLAALCRAAGCSAESAPLEAVQSASLVVHCTTVGLGTDELPFDPALLAPGATLVDLVYSAAGPTALGGELGADALRSQHRAAADARRLGPTDGAGAHVLLGQWLNNRPRNTRNTRKRRRILRSFFRVVRVFRGLQA